VTVDILAGLKGKILLLTEIYTEAAMPPGDEPV
jgi:hypothetical protein